MNKKSYITIDACFRMPVAEDATRVWDLVTDCPPLDQNSLYCNILQCTDFAETCVIAEQNGQIAGWLSGYRPPNRPDSLFIWQIAVHPNVRGKGIAKAMIESLVDRLGNEKINYILATITSGNQVSWGLFSSIAQDLGGTIESHAHFDRVAHFSDRHDSELLVTIGPISSEI